MCKPVLYVVEGLLAYLAGGGAGRERPVQEGEGGDDFFQRWFHYSRTQLMTQFLLLLCSPPLHGQRSDWSPRYTVLLLTGIVAGRALVVFGLFNMCGCLFRTRKKFSMRTPVSLPLPHDPGERMDMTPSKDMHTMGLGRCSGRVDQQARLLVLSPQSSMYSKRWCCLWEAWYVAPSPGLKPCRQTRITEASSSPPPSVRQASPCDIDRVPPCTAR